MFGNHKIRLHLLTFLNNYTAQLVEAHPREKILLVHTMIANDLAHTMAANDLFHTMAANDLAHTMNAGDFTT